MQPIPDSHFTYNKAANLLHGWAVKLMGTRLDVLIVDSRQESAESCWEEILAETCRLESLFSKFNPESELYKINKAASRQPIKVSDELWQLLIDCKRYHTLTKGYFDITLKDYNTVLLDTKTQTIAFTANETELDLGALGKGYALAKIKQIVIRHDIQCALINFGNSSVLGIGTHPYGDTWPIGIENPYKPKETLHIVNLKDSSLSTSGNTPTHPKHIIDPHTSHYLERKKIVSVKTANPIEAEILSTTFVITPDTITKEIIKDFPSADYTLFDLE
ncbi:FAD:protein FMN transferase [Massilibacteroides sp.]|uniref:FAD:protein FMN transferase n=1 Tax=Massilibacteroides sp. TaxID=2034766 RepID=UPI0026111107|nr:FAD:protein FMN transferase [Massilibacteroides sp.]MDD4514975.1 FAD:protein FMN transferase [Massilibacteroides sp.]